MLQRLYSWYGKKAVWTVTAVVILIIVSGFIFNARKEVAINETPALSTVRVASITDLSSTIALSLIGTVRAVSEAEIETEAVGRITAVSVSLGDTVRAGQIIATQENASQRASVLQAEGAYEAALASAGQSNISISSAENAVSVAKNNLIASYNSLFTSANTVLLADIDDFFSNPNNSVPGLYISGKSYTQTLNSERVAFTDIMKKWQQNSATINPSSDLTALSLEAQKNTERLIRMIDIFIQLINDQSATEVVGGVPVESYNSILITDRATLNATMSALKNNLSNLATANESLQQAKIGGSNTELSSANAQVKQALGSLRAAQANLEKTILRSPISGTVNSLSVNLGDFVGSFTEIAKIANNNALEISSFVGESDLRSITVGSEVVIENEYPGIVTHVAAGIDSNTQKTEVKIATETAQLTNGDTVRIVIYVATDESENKTILLPITAIKFSAENGAVFTVNNGELVAHQITIGAVRGSNVEVLTGVTSDMEIVVDARGLSSGSKVESVK